ncbi:hypothetical protein ACFPYJ_03640 [Paenibacillus solisilvae]|uniref:Uncharacterized protein n=1 Tax=Paenibacillus solisilvae TaxID=2486751 RepID=A0ABW0VUJ2_9BACL
MNTSAGRHYKMIFSRLMAVLIISTGLLAAAGCSSDNQSASNSAADLNAGSDASTASAAQGSVKGSDPQKGNPYETAGIADPQAFDAMFDALKTAVANGDKNAAAAYILYPLRVNGTGSALKIANKEEFLKQYDEIFTEPIKQALAKQTKDSLFVNYQGVMVGNGEIWFGGDISAPQKLGIITVNHDIAPAK